MTITNIGFMNDTQAYKAARKALCETVGKPDRDYALIGNRSEAYGLPHGDVTAAWDDIAMALAYLVGQGVSRGELAIIVQDMALKAGQ